MAKGAKRLPSWRIIVIRKKGERIGHPRALARYPVERSVARVIPFPI